MSFSGLQERVKKKAMTTAAAAAKENTASQSSANNSTTDAVKTIYAVAVEAVQANHTVRKRQRSSSEEACSVQDIVANDTASTEILKPAQLITEKVILKNLTEPEFLARRSLMEEVLLRSAAAISRSIETTSVTSSLKDVDQDPHVSCITALPLPLCDFLNNRLQSSLDTSAVSTTTYEDDEYNLFCFLKIALENGCDEHVNVWPLLEAHVSILRTFWLVLCWHWLMALRGTDASSSSESGWSYNAYLLLKHALPHNIRQTHGRKVAQALEAWREAYRVRQNVLDFLAYLLHDVEVAMRNAEKKGQDSAEDARIIPVEVIDALFSIVKNLRRRQFATCRQIYVDLTMGTANWKLGLFSGGEVHMRRSMERIERRRIAHLLHNEKAVRLLHALRELVDFVQKYEALLKSSGLFCD